MKLKTFNNSQINIFRFFLPLVAIALLLGIAACEKDDDVPDFAVDFNFELVDENNVVFTNLSSGDYYWLVWDYGDGQMDTTTDKNEVLEKFYPIAQNYDVTLHITNYYGSTKSVSKSFSISNDTVNVDFTMKADTAIANYVMLTNTSVGNYQSFMWKYLDQVVVDETEHLAFFPFAGEYDVELVLVKDGQESSYIQKVSIAEDNENLVWAEEFSYTGDPDESYWNMETGGGGWGNNELQTYTDSEDNAYVNNGVLTITAREESAGEYTSARMTTKNKFDFKYGRIEARIKLPYGQGLWPAFWMLGANIDEVSWPYCGEIDIMEMVGGENQDNTCHATLHWWNDSNNSKADYGESYTLPSGIFADDFHVFKVVWDAEKIRAYVDDIEYYVIDISGDDFSEFHQDFFIILNMAVGGDWPGSPDDTTVFPQTMQVDWVRVYSE